MMFFLPFLLLTMKTKNHIVDKAFTGSSAGASAPGSGPGSRWFKSTLPENAKGTVSTVPFCIFRGHSGFETEHQQKPSVRRVLQRRWPEAGLPGGVGQIQSARIIQAPYANKISSRVQMNGRAALDQIILQVRPILHL